MSTRIENTGGRASAFAPAMPSRVRGNDGDDTTGTEQSAKTADEGVITRRERAFFAGMFPEASAEIQSHQVYSREGSALVSQPTGSLIDRKG